MVHLLSSVKRECIKTTEIDELIFEDIKLTRGNSPEFTLKGKEIDIWSAPNNFFHSKSTIDYITEKILECERKGEDVFPSIVGKESEKELVKNALLSGSSVLFKGKKGYGKTTFSKAIAELLPSKVLSIRGCKINDDPTHPSCFSCKKKILENKKVELAWTPRIWIRIPGDPMLTTRQLIGGISIQKIRGGYDLDHPEAFIPGRALKANRGVGYFDELGAVPSSLQTLLHEFFEEHQVTTVEGDIVPFKIDTLELASTNPANYRGINPIKEPLLDRMEEIEIGPPESLEEEIEIGLRNAYYTRNSGNHISIPYWHLKILARTVRYARNKDKCEIARKIESEPSCRATIKLFDHLQSRAVRMKRTVPLTSDYGLSYEIIKLAIKGRIEVEYAYLEKKDEIIEELVDEALRKTCKEIYDALPQEKFTAFFKSLNRHSESVDKGKFLPMNLNDVLKLRKDEIINEYVNIIARSKNISEDLYLSTIDIILKSISYCLPKSVTSIQKGYLLHELKLGNEA